MIKGFIIFPLIKLIKFLFMLNLFLQILLALFTIYIFLTRKRNYKLVTPLILTLIFYFIFVFGFLSDLFDYFLDILIPFLGLDENAIIKLNEIKKIINPVETSFFDNVLSGFIFACLSILIWYDDFKEIKNKEVVNTAVSTYMYKLVFLFFIWVILEGIVVITEMVF